MNKSGLPALTVEPGIREYGKHNQCQHIKANGKRCRVYVRPGSKYCFFHDPKKAEARAIACSKGGRSRKVTIILPLETPDFVIHSSRDVVTLLEETINQARRGQLDPRIAQNICNLAGTIIRAQAEMRESGELQEEKKKAQAAAQLEFRKKVLGDKQLSMEIEARLEAEEDQEYKAILQSFNDRQEWVARLLEEKAKESKNPEEFLEEATKLAQRLGFRIPEKAGKEAEKVEKSEKSQENAD